MRVLVLENEPTTRRGGQELSLFDICQGLADRGHILDLLYTKEGDLLPSYRTFCRRVDRVSAYAIDRHRTLRAAARLLFEAWRSRPEPPDVVYANQYLDSLFARLVAWRFGRPFVCHLRLAPPSTFCAQYRWGLGGVSRFIANSHAIRADYARCGFEADRITVVHNGIDVRVWQPKTPAEEIRQRLGLHPETFLLLYAGRLHPSKGLDVLIDALAALRDSALVIAGSELEDGSGRHYEKELRQQAERLGVAGVCHFVGQVSAIADYYAAADVTVLPSLHGEAFGRVLIESMACGTPVVASASGGIPEILTGEFASGLVPPGHRVALVDRLETLRNWRRRDPALGLRCRRHVEANFSLIRTVTGVQFVLQRAVREWRADLALEQSEVSRL